MDFDEITENLQKAEKLESYRPDEAKEIYLDAERSVWEYITENGTEEGSKEMMKAGLYLKKAKEGFKRLGQEK